MLATKQHALNVINKLPETVGIDEIMYQLYLLEKIHKGQNDIKNNRTLSSEELRQEIEQW